MNKLEKALLDETDAALDFYLEDTPTSQVRKDVEQIKNKATMSTEAGRLKKAVLHALGCSD